MAAKPKKSKSVLVVVSSAEQLPRSGRRTGYYVPEVAEPYWEFESRGYTVDFASPAGGTPTPDGAALEDEASKAFVGSKAFARLNNSRRLSEIDVDGYDAIFFPGGLGPMVDIAYDPAVKRAIAKVYESGGVVGAVCHGPVALWNVRLSGGEFLIAGRNVAGFTNQEEQVYGWDDVPFLLEDTLRAQGARHTGASKFEEHVVTDGRLVTGQNPASAAGVARAMIGVLESD